MRDKFETFGKIVPNSYAPVIDDEGNRKNRCFLPQFRKSIL
jgi:hypothetical protein